MPVEQISPDKDVNSRDTTRSCSQSPKRRAQAELFVGPVLSTFVEKRCEILRIGYIAGRCRIQDSQREGINTVLKEHIALLREQGLPVPPINSDPKIVIENEKKLAVA